MNNETEITRETIPTDAPEPATPKSKNGMIIGIVSVAIVVILIMAFILMSGPGVEGKWIIEKSETLNPDGSVNNTYIAPPESGEWMEIKSDGIISYGNNSGIHDYSMMLSFTWEYINDNQIEITTHYDPSITIPDQVINPDTGEITWNNKTLSEESQIYEYEIDGDTLTLGFLTPNDGVTLRMTLVKE